MEFKPDRRNGCSEVKFDELHAFYAEDSARLSAPCRWSRKLRNRCRDGRSDVTEEASPTTSLGQACQVTLRSIFQLVKDRRAGTSHPACDGGIGVRIMAEMSSRFDRSCTGLLPIRWKLALFAAGGTIIHSSKTVFLRDLRMAICIANIKDLVVLEGMRSLTNILKEGDFEQARGKAEELAKRLTAQTYPQIGWHRDAAGMVDAVVSSSDLSVAVERWNAVVQERMKGSGNEISGLEIPVKKQPPIFAENTASDSRIPLTHDHLSIIISP
jgi:hypothetical protein